MRQPAIQALFGEDRLIDLVERQTEKVLTIDCLRGGKFIAGGRPVADQAGTSGGAGIVNQADGVDKFIGVFFLVAEPEDRHHLASEIGCRQLRQELFPAWLGKAGRQNWQLTLAERRATENQPVAGSNIGQRRAADIDWRIRRVPQLFRNLLGDQPGAAGIGAEKDADFCNFQASTVMFLVSFSGRQPTGWPRLRSGPFSNWTR